MKIAVVAANGRSGQVFVKAALGAGHEIRAGVRSSRNNLPEHPNLTIVHCDATSTNDLTNLVNGQDAVVSLIGHVKGSPPDVQSNAINQLIKIMDSSGPKRLISLTGTGVRVPGDKITIMDRILNLGISLVDPNRIKDGLHHVELIKKTGLDWTIIRVLKLQNTAPRPYQLTKNGPTKLYVSREEVAQAILEVLENNSFVREAPILSR
jgi:putative NADH-flavin reductase